MKVPQLVKVWINLSYRYFSPYSPQRTNCNALDLLLAANTEDCFFLSVLDAPSAKNQGSRVVTATMVHQRVWFNKAFMPRQGENATLRLIASASVLWWSQQQVFLNVKRANRFSLAVYQMGQRVSRLYWLWVDRGDSGHRFLKWVMDCLGWMIQVVLRPQQTQGFVLLKKRSVVEQTFGLLNWYRRLSKDDR